VAQIVESPNPSSSVLCRERSVPNCPKVADSRERKWVSVAAARERILDFFERWDRREKMWVSSHLEGF